jgi:hypothetical protein
MKGEGGEEKLSIAKETMPSKPSSLPMSYILNSWF